MYVFSPTMHSSPSVAPWRMWTLSQTLVPGPSETPGSILAVGWMRGWCDIFNLEQEGTEEAEECSSVTVCLTPNPNLNPDCNRIRMSSTRLGLGLGLRLGLACCLLLFSAASVPSCLNP